MRVLCVFGRHNYGDPKRGDSPEYNSFVPAFERLGHTVRHFESWNRLSYPTLAPLNQALLDEVEAFRPDVIFTAQILTEIWIETWETIKARGDVATIALATDDSWKYREVSRFIGPAFHAMATLYEYVIPRYHADGVPHVLLTQMGAPSSWLRPPTPAAQCRYSVSFVGMAHGNRPQLVAQLRQSGIEVSCFGYGWDSGPVASEDIPRIVNNSVISLNFANSKTHNQIKARLFEVPGAGGFLLTEHADGIERFYVADQEIAVYSRFDELVAKIKYYLDHLDQRDAIAQAGYERTVREHTYERRVSKIIDFVLSAKAQTPASIPSRAFSEAIKAHELTFGLRLIRWSLVKLCSALFGRVRGPRAARRLVFELSWRLAGRHTFTAAGWPGRLFPHD